MFDISPIQIIIVLVIALLVFGPKKLPELARSVGRGVREFRGAISLDSDGGSSSLDRGGSDPRPSRPTSAVVQGDGGAADDGGAATGQASPGGDEEPVDGIVVSGEMPPPARPPDRA